VSDPGITKGLIRKIVTNFKLPYFTVTPTFSVCPSHGYLNGRQERCSICDEETEVYSRVVGYLRPVKQWNDGKRAEFSLRKTYKLHFPAGYPASQDFFSTVHEEGKEYLLRKAGQVS
jgi:ribonucleoside-triphosphate reductase